ncbi:MAG: hypothetical protein ACREMX_16030, partial [Gemmatimonadales bacterium]
MGAQQGVHAGDLKLPAEHVDRIGAEEAEGVRPEEPVPVLLQADRRGTPARLPQQADRLAIGAESRAPCRGLDKADGAADDALEAGPVRLPVHHESVQR